MKIYCLALFTSIATSAIAQTSADVVCTYAPSQSKAVTAISGAAGGAATTAAVATATGLTVVAHSSGALILTGASGYIGGTIGATAATVAAAPMIVMVGLLVGGAAVTVELVCAHKNHPEQVAKVEAAAEEFSSRFKIATQRAKRVVGKVKKSIVPASGRAVVTVKSKVLDVWQYAFRKDEASREKGSK